MKRFGSVAVLTASVVLGIWGASLTAQHGDPHPADKAPPPAAVTVKMVGMAYGLIEYGRENKVADALVAAAILLEQNKLDALPDSEKSAMEAPLSLLKEARTLTEDPAVMKRIDSLEEQLKDPILSKLIAKSRKSVGGTAYVAERTIAAGGAIEIDRTFLAKECAKIQVTSLSQLGGVKNGKQIVNPPNDVRLTIFAVSPGKKTQVDQEYGKLLEYHAYPSVQTKYQIILSNPHKDTARVRVITN